MANKEQNTSYSARLRESTKVLTKLEEFRVVDGTGAVNLKDVTEAGPVLIDFAYMALVDVHNDKAQGEKDYVVTVVVDKAGTMYRTSSESLSRAINDILAVLGDEPGWVLQVMRQPSKNRAGQYFLTAGVVEAPDNAL